MGFTLFPKCDGCGETIYGVTTGLKKVKTKDGRVRQLCKSCESNPEGTRSLYCNSCQTYVTHAKMKGSDGLELFLYICWIFPGILYSIWRRSGGRNICPNCGTAALIPRMMPDPQLAADQVECPFCAEKIAARAKKCKHCGSDVMKK